MGVGEDKRTLYPPVVLETAAELLVGTSDDGCGEEDVVIVVKVDPGELVMLELLVVVPIDDVVMLLEVVICAVVVLPAEEGTREDNGEEESELEEGTKLEEDDVLEGINNVNDVNVEGGPEAVDDDEPPRTGNDIEIMIPGELDGAMLVDTTDVSKFSVVGMLEGCKIVVLAEIDMEDVKLVKPEIESVALLELKDVEGAEVLALDELDNVR